MVQTKPRAKKNFQAQASLFYYVRRSVFLIPQCESSLTHTTPPTNQPGRPRPFIRKPIKTKPTINKRQELEKLIQESHNRESFRKRTQTLPADLQKSIVSYIDENPNENINESINKLLDPTDFPASNTRSKNK